MYNALQRRLREAREDEGGFTLIELLIVIVILGVLAAVVVFSVSGITNRGVVASCKATQKTLQVAVEAARANSGSSTPVATFGALVPNYLQSDSNFDSTTGATKDVTFSSGYARKFVLNTTTGEVSVQTTAGVAATC